MATGQRFQGPGETLVVSRLGRRQVERVKRLRLVVMGIARCKSFEGVGHRFHARDVRPLGEAVVIGRDRFDVKPLALSLSANGPAARDRLLRLLRLRGAGAGSKGIPDVDGGDAPICDRTTRIVVQHIEEGLPALLPPKRMQQGDTALKHRLNGAVA
jgi:hypothetical protein